MPRQNVWNSQPTLPGSRIPIVNFLLSFAILVAGGSASKVLQTFKHMELACISLTTYFQYQRDKLFPTILLHWRKYQSKMIEEIKESEESVIVAGDSRHDSMGHCAKYGTYTMFCCSKPQIIHFELVQRNEAGNSGAMEMVGFKRSLSYLLGCGLVISTFISDRHSSIAKYMREQMTGITHYFDLLHLKKSVRKALTKIACESKCEALKEWIYPCLNHLHWSATTTLCGTGRIILAKFHSFLGHIVNKHENLDDHLFNRCSHGNSIKQRKWLQPGV
ncbi:hypothetical protein QZH41_012632 [Actinostola sp. cb2023]|nr:hypothetical protein QZH41_012632 [Actinostola sp. cb2023]